MELKEQIKKELLDQKEKKQKLLIEQNSKLKEITLFTKPEHPICKNYIKYFTENGIKFKEKDITKYPEVISTVQLSTAPIIQVNKEYLVHGREFNNPQQCTNVLRHFANPDYIVPSSEIRLIESIKNLNSNIGKQFQNLNRQIQPIVKILNQLAEEEKNEQKNN